MENKTLTIAIGSEWRKCKEENMIYIHGAIRGIIMGVADSKTNETVRCYRIHGVDKMNVKVDALCAEKIMNKIEENYPELCMFSYE